MQLTSLQEKAAEFLDTKRVAKVTPHISGYLLR